DLVRHWLAATAGHAPDLVIATGDLSENGRPSELREAARALDLLARELRLGRGRILLLPGSRDVNRDACAAYFSECEAEERTPEPPWAPKWRSFATAWRDFYKDAAGGPPAAAFTEEQPWSLFEIPELGLAVAALDSTIGASHRPEDAGGLLGAAQVEWFTAALEPARRKGWLRLAALHHRRDTLRDAAAFTAQLAPAVHLVLEGEGGADAAAGARLLHLEPGLLRIHHLDDGSLTEEPFDASGAPAAFFGPGGEETETEPPPLLRHSEGPPGGDDFLARVEAACRFRERPGAEIRRVREDHPGGGLAGTPIEYLRVIVPEGGVVRIYPVGILEHGATREGLETFLARVDARYREDDSGLVSRLVYGGDQPAPADLVREAAERRVHLLSFIELQGLVDFRPFVERQTRRLTESLHYPPADYVPARLAWNGPAGEETSDDAAGRLLEWLASPHGRFVLILGDAGTGKTFLLHEIARRLGERGGLIPVLLEMRHLEKGRTLDQLLGQHLAASGIEELSVARFRYMLEQGRIALLFDGFDELAARVTYPRAVEHFETLLQAASGAAKVVVTGRRQHFASDHQVRTVLGEEVDRLAGRRVAVLAPFDNGRIRELLLRRAGGDAGQAEARLAVLESTAGLLGLSRNPRMLTFISALSEERLQRARSPQGDVTAAAVYRVLIERWLEAEIDRARPEGSGDLPLLSLGDRLEALTRLALRLWRTGAPSLSLAELTEEVGRTIASLRRAPIDPAAAVFQVGSGTLLVRDADGAFSFLHPSLLEWLVAWRVSAELTVGHEPAGLAGREMSPLTADFLLTLAGRDRTVAWARTILRGDQAASSDGAKASALVLLRRAGVESLEPVALAGRDLRGQDLSGRDLAGADLSGADLSAALLVGAVLTGARLHGTRLAGTDLTGAHLGGADLTEAELTGARLNGATLDGARLSTARLRRAKLIGSRRAEAHLDGCDLFGAALHVSSAIPGSVAVALPSAAVAWSPGPHADLLATADGRLVRIWEAATLKELRRFAGHEAPVRGLAWSPDGRWLASASEDRTVRLWEVETGRELTRLWGHGSWVTSVAFQPRGSLLASGSYDRTARLWDLETGKEVRRLPGHWVLCVAFHPSGRHLATGGGDRLVHLWDVVTGAERSRFDAHTDYVRSVAFGLRGTVVASASDDRTVRLWDSATTRELFRLEHQDPVLAVAFDADGEVLATASEDRTVRLWNAVTGREERRFLGHTRAVQGVAVQPGGELVASGSLDGSIRLWSAASGQETRRSPQPAQTVAGLAFSPGTGAPILCSGAHDGSVRLWNVDTLREEHRFPGERDRIWSVAVAPRGDTLAVATVDGAVHLWDLATRDGNRHIGGLAGGAFCVAFSPDGTLLATGAADRTVSLWNPATARLRRRLSGFSGAVRGVAFSPDGTLLAAATPDPVLQLWDPRTGLPVGELRGHESNLFAVAFSPGGTLLAAGSNDHTVRLWDLASREEAYRLKGHQDAVWCLAWSRRDNLLASGSLDGTVRIWDLTFGIEKLCLTGHLHRVLALAWSPDGKLLASGSSDNTIRLWDTATGACRATLGLLPEGWVAFEPDGGYRQGGLVGGGFWHTLGLCRFEAGELDPYAPGLRRE
ncbi:MAG TPA: hypothetical protein DD490_00425, partial [Acidobacteria bacterium]|nr:hypothetical protein [Acidobacteriota bacterium]